MPLNHKPILVAASLARRACLVYTQGQDNHNGHGMSPPRTHRSARNPILPVLIIVACLAAGAAAFIGYRLLQRKSRLQREADAHLAVLRRDKANRYGEVRPPR